MWFKNIFSQLIVFNQGLYLYFRKFIYVMIWSNLPGNEKCTPEAMTAQCPEHTHKEQGVDKVWWQPGEAALQGDAFNAVTNDAM